MNTQIIIKDQSGTPVSVLIDYADWLEIQQRLNLNSNESEEPDWYTLTETSRAILNEIIVYTGREELKELKKDKPDHEHITTLRKLCDEIQTINLEPDNFKSPSRMQEIIDKYAPIVRKINDGA